MIGDSIRIAGAVQNLYELSGKPYNPGEMRAVAGHYISGGAIHTTTRADIVELVLDNGEMTTREITRSLGLNGTELIGILGGSLLSPIRLGVLSYEISQVGHHEKIYRVSDAHKGRMYVALMRQLLRGE